MPAEKSILGVLLKEFAEPDEMVLNVCLILQNTSSKLIQLLQTPSCVDYVCTGLLVIQNTVLSHFEIECATGEWLTGAARCLVPSRRHVVM